MSPALEIAFVAVFGAIIGSFLNVVILIIGILAAIALPAFLGQREKGQDADAKSNARNIVSHMESCYATTETYVGCNTSADITNSGIPTANYTLSGLTTDGFVVVATSKSGNTFTITKTASGSTRSCTGDGGCNNSTW